MDVPFQEAGERLPGAQHVILTVKWGPLNGRKAVLAPGQALRVGRGQLADLMVPNDAQMSAVHCELRWDGERCSFRDLDSARGVLQNGAPAAEEGELRHGDWLKVGETMLTVHFEGSTPRRLDALGANADEEEETRRREALEAERTARAEETLVALRRTAGEAPLYALLDAARDRRILELCREAVEEHHSLYDGVKGETMAHVAPYLARLSAESRLLGALVREGWGKRWGVYLTSPHALPAVRRHLRRYLMVERESDHQRVYFRFYDPAVLGVFLGTIRVLQRSELFREIDSFLFEAEGFALVSATAEEV